MKTVDLETLQHNLRLDSDSQRISLCVHVVSLTPNSDVLYAKEDCHSYASGYLDAILRRHTTWDTIEMMVENILHSITYKIRNSRK